MILNVRKNVYENGGAKLVDVRIINSTCFYQTKEFELHLKFDRHLSRVGGLEMLGSVDSQLAHHESYLFVACFSVLCLLYMKSLDKTSKRLRENLVLARHISLYTAEW